VAVDNDQGTELFHLASSKGMWMVPLLIDKFPKGLNGSLVRGLATQNSLQKGQLILKLPWDNVVRSSTCKDWEACRISLVLQILTLAGKEQFQWYLDSLPTADELSDYHPFAASDDLLSHFNDLPIFKQITIRQTEMKQRWQKFSAHYSLKQWLWAELIIFSRAWSESNQFMDLGHGELLFPIIDMLNTDYVSRQNVHLDFGNLKEGKPITLTAKKTIAAGEELIGDYGLKSTNDRFYTHYGFVVFGNPFVLQALERPRCPEWIGSIDGSCSCTVPDRWQNESRNFCSLSFLAMEYCRESLSAEAQRCWTTLGRLPPAEDITAMGFRVFFRNRLPGTVRLHWVPADGRSRVVVVEEISSDEVVAQETFLGHAFEADYTSEDLQRSIPAQTHGPYIAREPGQIFNIGDDEFRKSRSEL
jgi:hypothetical protein